MLTGLARKYRRDQVLDQILFPSKVIAPEFKTVTLTLSDGNEVSGLVIKRTETEWTLRDAGLFDHQTMRANVKETRESTVSAMPEGLLAPLTAQEAADLLEYLVSQ